MTAHVSSPAVHRRALIGGAAAFGLAAAIPRPARTAASAAAFAADPLPSWNDGPNKQAILDFVAAVTTEGGDQFVPAEDRIAVFDNDGTLWLEQPVYNQAFFAIDEVKRLAPEHPEWEGQEPWTTILSGDPAKIAALDEVGIAQAVAVVFTGMTVDAYQQNVADWFASAQHPVLKRPYAEVTYQPQQELLDYLRANGFSTWIVTGGGVDFLRVASEDLYGIPPEQIIGSATEVTWEMVDGEPNLVKQPKLGIHNDKEGKPINIHLGIGKRPILAFGNSDGDQQMLEYTAAGDGPSLMLLVHHDDAAREVAYDRDSPVGKLDTALDEAVEKGWNVVSMKDDWATIFG